MFTSHVDFQTPQIHAAKSQALSGNCQLGGIRQLRLPIQDVNMCHNLQPKTTHRWAVG